MSSRQLAGEFLAAALIMAMAGCSGVRQEGPIQRSAEVGVDMPSRGVLPLTFGMPLSPTAGPVTLASVELPVVTGLEIVAVKTCQGSPWTGDSFLNCAPTGVVWPPPGVALGEVAGTLVGAEPQDQGGLLVGARLLPGANWGQVDGVRITYAYNGITYQVDQPWTFSITSP
ncbi:MAG: hypothetical protein ABI452_02820 [Candidatus Limnocylindrales bacterium]